MKSNFKVVYRRPGGFVAQAVRKKRVMRPKVVKSKLYNKYKKSKQVALIKSVIYRNAEHKLAHKDLNLSPGILATGLGSLNGNYIMLTPQGGTASVANGISISRGTNSIQRVGNKIRTNSGILRYSIVPKPYNATTNALPCPVIVRMFFFKWKTSPTGVLSVNDLCSTTTSTFFENGNAYAPFTGYLLDYTRKVSSDDYTYLGMKQHKVGPQYNNVATSGPSGTFYQNSNNDFKLAITGSINVKKYLPKEVSFDDNDTVTTPYVWCVIQVVRADDNQINAPSNVENPVEIRMTYDYTYTDI